MPPGISEFKTIIKGCVSRSEKDILDCYGQSMYFSEPSLSEYETIDDYLKSCELTFEYMSDKDAENVTTNVFFVSAVNNTLTWKSFYSMDNYPVIHTVVGAEYIGSDGISKTEYKDFYIIYSKEDGGILTVSV